MGVGKLLSSAAARGVDEGAGVETIGPPEELQAVTINNPNRLFNTSIDIFFILRHQSLTDPSTIKGAYRVLKNYYSIQLFSDTTEMHPL
jgi:ADP-ribose pyrophosphatase YjhB (NUDIX family)